LRDLGRSERPETAHALLLELGLWDETVNPYPQRLGVSLDIPGIVLGEISPAPRRDLTHLTAYAVDDPGNQEPDDALSWEDGRLWVHVADVAGLVTPDSPADLDARARGATLYLPEGAVPMLPPEVIRRLGLGFSDVSPALSFGIDLDALGEVAQVEIVLSQVRVERLSYEQAQERLEEAPFSALHTLAAGNLQRRLAAGAMQIDLPEVKLRIDQGQIEIYPILRLGSRTMVREAMLLAGEAAAQYALQHDLPIPFAIQDAPLEKPGPSASPGMAEQYALRRVQQRSAVAGLPGLHAGLGLSAYTRATSPLRRYLDLVVHQQIRAFLLGSVLLDEQQILERVGASEAIVPVINRAEILSVRHWTLVYLQRHPDWCGKAVLVDRRGRSSRFILPELAFETQLHLRKDLPMNSELTFALKGIDLAEQEAHFAVI
jgi:exoribonuclease-2